MEFLPEYGLALSSGTVALFRRANGALAAVFAMTEREAFVKGFTIGARIIIEVMTNNSDI